MSGLEILILEEVAGILKVSVKTARRRVASGKIRSFREGGRVCVWRHDLEQYLESLQPIASI